MLAADATRQESLTAICSDSFWNVPMADTHTPLTTSPPQVAAAPAVQAADVPPIQPGLISAIEIKRFKGIDALRLDLSNAPTILVGANNSGKSSVLHGVHFAVSVAQTSRLVGEGVTWRSDKFELSFNPTQLIWSPVADVMSLAKGGRLEEAALRCIEVVLYDTAGNQSTVTVRRGRNRNVQVAIVGRTLGERLQDLTQPFSVYTPGLAGISREERFLSSGVVRRSVARGDANLVLRNVLLMLHRDEAKWNVFLSDMQVVFPQIAFDVSFHDSTDETIGTTVRIADGPVLPLDAAGTAVLQAAQILGYSALYNPPLVLLDEPDSHLHPNNQRALCQLLRQLAANRRFRLLISSHSRHVLDALRGSSEVVWMANGGIASGTDATLTARLLDLGALDTVDFFADRETKCVVITEDSDTAPLDALLNSSGFVEEDTRVASYSGCSRVDAATVLGQFIESNTNNVSVLVHRDRDFMDHAQAKDYTQCIERCGLRAFVTAGTDVEWYFLNPDHLAELNPGASAADISRIIAESIDETRDTSIAKMVNIRTERAFRDRARTGRAPDHGRIAVDAARDYDANPRSNCHGKTVLGVVAAKLQAYLGRNPRLFQPTPHLVCPELLAVAAQIWRPVRQDHEEGA